MYYHSNIARFLFDPALDARSPELTVREIVCACNTHLRPDAPHDIGAAKCTLVRHLSSCKAATKPIRSVTAENLAVYDRDMYNDADLGTPGELRVAFHAA